MLVPVLATGLLYASILYYENKHSSLSRPLSIVLFGLRFLAVSLIAFLLLSPYLKQTKKSVEQPTVILAVDNSASMVSASDSAFIRSQLPGLINSFKSSLSDDFAVVDYTFGRQVKRSGVLDFSEQQTDYSDLMTTVASAYYNRNVGALVVFSDGLNNAGVQPELSASAFPFPLYTVLLGDTSIFTDLSITDVRFNQLVYNQADFPVEVSFKATDAPGTATTIELLSDDKVIAGQNVSLSGQNSSGSITLMVQASGSGRKKLTARIKALDNEKLLQNNERSFYVDLVNEKQKVLILGVSPHPDLGAIKSVFDDYFDVSLQSIGELTSGSAKYSLIILHQLPATGNDPAAVRRLLEINPDASVFFITGMQTDFTTLNQLQSGLHFSSSSGQGPMDIFPLANNSFALFNADQAFAERIAAFPALLSPLLEINPSMAFHPLLTQKIRSVSTAYPMLGFAETPNRRMGFLIGTGLWKWRLADFQLNGNNQTFQELFSKSIQYLMVRKDQRRLKVIASDSYLLNDRVILRAELYNQSFEKVKDAKITIRLNTLDDSTNINFEFTPEGNDYQLNAGRLPAGGYTYHAEAITATEKLEASGSFVVAPSTFEQQQLKADHHLLRRLAAVTSGKAFNIDQLPALATELNDNPAIASVSSFTRVYDPLISITSALILILILLTAEWFLRKFNGAY